MQRLIETANTHRISFNAFEASRSSLSMLTSAEFKFSQYTPGPVVEQIRTTNLQNGLVMPASETGGKAYLNRSGFFPDHELIEQELCSYYSLGYTSASPGSQQTHSIKVKVKGREGLQLRYRSSYSERPEAERREDKLMSVLALGWSENPLGIRLEHGDIETVVDQHDTYLVPISVTVPLASLACLPGRSGDTSCRVRLQMRASDDKGRVSGLYEKLYDIRVARDTPPQAQVKLLINNKMRGGAHRLVMAVMDDMTHAASYLVYPVTVGSS